jgi:hypothetical protein
MFAHHTLEAALLGCAIALGRLRRGDRDSRQPNRRRGACRRWALGR